MGLELKWIPKEDWDGNHRAGARPLPAHENPR